VSYLDPLVPEVDEGGIMLRSRPLSTPFSDVDAVVIVTDHTAIDYARLLREATIVVDTRDALRGVEGDTSKIIRL
jgi:UDP-N-acetyl-D-glucosamine dehydrogenase